MNYELKKKRRGGSDSGAWGVGGPGGVVGLVVVQIGEGWRVRGCKLFLDKGSGFC